MKLWMKILIFKRNNITELNLSSKIKVHLISVILIKLSKNLVNLNLHIYLQTDDSHVIMFVQSLQYMQ